MIAFICAPSSSHNTVLTDAHYHHPEQYSAPRQINGLSEGDINQPLVDLDSESDQDDLEEIQFRTVVPSHHQHLHDHSDDEHEHGHHHHILPGETGSIEYILLLIALSVHSIFEGIALGAQQELNGFMKFLLSVMVHEVLCSFAYGVSLSKQRIPLKKALGSILFLSFSLPIGILVMAWIGTFEALTALIFRFVLEGIAAEIFIYVASIEMLSTEIPHLPSKAGFVKAFVVVIGAAAFFFINLLLT
uniref:Uncharacterized protein n=1 Tax=Panagrolaimus superbus TaxID=310955 RepID=A0A914Y7R8_9BILA